MSYLFNFSTFRRPNLAVENGAADENAGYFFSFFLVSFTNSAL